MTRLKTAFITLLSVLFGAGFAQAQNLTQYQYGADGMQQLDVYAQSNANNAPIIVMLHGGAWRIGDKRAKAVWKAKVDHWLPRGYIFVSVNTRLLPEAGPLMQMKDLAVAMKFVQDNAQNWGGDAKRIVLMGHSSGGHVAALLATRQEIQERSDVKPWLGTVVLDAGALDVPLLMEGNPKRFHKSAFGTHPKRWRLNSPAHHLSKGDRPMLLVCSSHRKQSCLMANAMAQHGTQLDVDITVAPINLAHAKVNKELGRNKSYTAIVDRWLAARGLP